MKKLSTKKRIILIGIAIVVVLGAAGSVYAAMGATAVATVAAAQKQLEDAFFEDGVVRAQTRAAVSSEAGGRVVKVYVREGQKVNAGDILLTLSADDLQSERALLEAELESVYAAWRQTLDQTQQQIAALAAQKAAQRSADITGLLDAQIHVLEASLNPLIEGSVAFSFERMLEMTDARMALLSDQLLRAQEETPAEVQAIASQLDAAKSQSASVSNQRAQYSQQIEAQRLELEAMKADPNTDPTMIPVYDSMIASLNSGGADSSYSQMQSVADAQVSRLQGDLKDAQAQIPQTVDALHTQMLALESERRALKEQYSQLTQSTHSQTLALIAQREQSAGAQDAQRRARSALDAQKELLEASMKEDSGAGAVYLAQAQRIETQLSDLDRRMGFMQITAPIDGVVGQFDIREGSYLTPGFEVTEVIDPKSLQVECMVLTGDVDGVSQTAAARVIWEKREGDVEYAAALARVSPVAVSSVSAVGLSEQRVKVWLDPEFDAEDSPGDGYQVRVRFVAASESALTVPRSALVKTDLGDAVYVIAEGKARLRAVSLGLEGNGEIAITDGLSAGEAVLRDPEGDGVREGMSVKAD